MLVCGRCAKGRRILSILRFSPAIGGNTHRREMVSRQRARSVPTEEYLIVEGYGELIRRAREKMGLTREALAALVGEKESTIRRVEAEQLEPTLELARRLEKTLKIKLLERVSEDAGTYSGDHASEFSITLGDIAEFRD